MSLEENLAMIADTVGYFRQQGRRVIYDAEHFFDGCKANRVRHQDRAGRGPGRRRDHRAVRHQRRQHAGRNRRIGPARSLVSCRCRSASIATTIASWPWPIRWPRRGRRRPGAGHDQRPGRTLRQCRPDHGRRQPGAEEAGLRSAAARQRRAFDRAVALYL